MRQIIFPFKTVGKRVTACPAVLADDWFRDAQYFCIGPLPLSVCDSVGHAEDHTPALANIQAGAPRLRAPCAQRRNATG